MLSFTKSVTITILLALLIRFFILQPFVVDGESMEPNFYNREYIIIDKISYRLRVPARGDVVVFHPPIAPAENYIKRVIGLPGESVEIMTDSTVYINNKKLNEAYIIADDGGKKPEMVTLGPDEYFLMGDNRGHSSDSRTWGPIHASKIEGRTWFVALPFQNFRFIRTPPFTLSLLPSFRAN